MGKKEKGGFRNGLPKGKCYKDTAQTNLCPRATIFQNGYKEMKDTLVTLDPSCLSFLEWLLKVPH